MAFKRDKQQTPATTSAAASDGGFKRDRSTGFFQQKGGLADYLPPWATNAMQGLDDVTQSAGAEVTRGYGADKQLTEEARARTTHTPTDIIASIAASPYKVTGMGAGALAGGLEGAARSYGNQEGWAPDWRHIGTDAAVGAGLGAGGAALPGIWNTTKTGLQKLGSVPKLATGAADMLLGGPYVTAGTGAAGAAGKVMPYLPSSAGLRDMLAKIAISGGT